MTTCLMPEKTKTPDEQAMTLRLPRAWHDKLREKAFHERRSMNALIQDALASYYDLPAVQAEEGRLGGEVRYRVGGTSAGMLADGK